MSNGEPRAGVQLDIRRGDALPFIERVYEMTTTVGSTFVTGQEAVAGVDQTPKDVRSAIVRTYNTSAINNSRASYWRKVPRKINVDLPLQLTEITAVFNKTTGIGEDLHPVSQQGTNGLITGATGAFNQSLNPRASATGSASVQPAIAPVFKRFPRRVTCHQCELYINGNFTEANLLAALGTAAHLNATVNAWPNFIERSDAFILQGQSVEVTAKADADSRVGFSASATSESVDYSYQYGNGFSKQTATSNDLVQFPPSIHAAVAVTPNSDSADAEASADASTVAIYINGGVIIPALPNATGTITATASASISPTSAATTSIQSVPTSGLWLYDWELEPSGFGDTFVTAYVIDATVFA